MRFFVGALESVRKHFETNFMPVTLVLLDSHAHAVAQAEGDAG